MLKMYISEFPLHGISLNLFLIRIELYHFSSSFPSFQALPASLPLIPPNASHPQFDYSSFL